MLLPDGFNAESAEAERLRFPPAVFGMLLLDPILAPAGLLDPGCAAEGVVDLEGLSPE